MGGTGGMISTQHDQSVQYRARRGRRRNGFARRVMAVMNNSSSLLSYTVDGSSTTTSAANQVGYFGIGLHGVGVQGSEWPAMFTGQYGALNINNTKLCCKTACLDVQIANTGITQADPPIDTEYLAIVDVYELVMRKRYPTAANVEDQYTTLYNQSNDGGTRSPNAPASSLFNAPEFCKYWKILSKREVRIAPGEIITLQKRFAKDKYIQGSRLQSEPSYLVGSFAYFFHFHGAPRATGGGQLAPTQLTMTWQKSYSFNKPPGQQQDSVQNA